MALTRLGSGSCDDGESPAAGRRHYQVHGPCGRASQVMVRSADQPELVAWSLDELVLHVTSGQVAKLQGQLMFRVNRIGHTFPKVLSDFQYVPSVLVPALILLWWVRKDCPASFRLSRLPRSHMFVSLAHCVLDLIARWRACGFRNLHRDFGFLGVLCRRP